MKSRYHIACLKFICLMLLFSSCSLVFAQSNWTGQAQCQLTVQAQNYSHEEVQTWTITGVPDANNTMVYPATWSVAGQGTLSSSTSQVQMSATWQTNVSPTSAPLKILVNSANQLIIGSYHAQLRVNAAVTGAKAVIVKGNETDVAISSTEFEWQFPQIQVDPTKTDVSDSSSIPITSAIGPMQPPGSGGTANCSWHFSKGAPGAILTGVNSPQMGAPLNIAASSGAPTTAGTNLASMKATPVAAIATSAAPTLQTATAQANALSCSHPYSIPAIPTSPSSVAASHAYNVDCLTPFTGTQWTPVAKLGFPQGHYVFMATVGIQNFSASNTIGSQQYSCRLAITYNQATTPVGSTSGTSAGQTAIVGLTINSPATGVEVDCATETGMTASAVTSVIATEVGALN